MIKYVLSRLHHTITLLVRQIVLPLLSKWGNLVRMSELSTILKSLVLKQGLIHSFIHLLTRHLLNIYCMLDSLLGPRATKMIFEFKELAD